MAKLSFRFVLFFPLGFLSACAGPAATDTLPPAGTASVDVDTLSEQYVIGPADQLDIFVWRNEELSRNITVQPDGRILLPLTGYITAIGKGPDELAREIEMELSTYIQDPRVSVIPTQFAAQYTRQISVLGEAVQPAVIPFRARLTLLDVLIAVGGLTQYADGNRAVIVREENGSRHTYRVFLNSLVRDGDIEQNVDMRPGDVLIIPQRYF